MLTDKLIISNIAIAESRRQHTVKMLERLAAHPTPRSKEALERQLKQIDSSLLKMRQTLYRLHSSTAA